MHVFRFRTHSQRKVDRGNAGKPVLYQTEKLPDAFRRQVVNIVSETIGPYQVQTYYSITYPANKWWDFLYKTIRHEQGVAVLTNEYDNAHEQCCNYILTANVDQALDMIELAFRLIESQGQRLEYENLEAHRTKVSSAGAIQELNLRLREHSIGLQFAGGYIIPLTSEYLHTEAVEPAQAS